MHKKARQSHQTLRRAVGFVASLSTWLSLFTAAIMVVASVSGTAKAETKTCVGAVGLWPDGAPQCLNGSEPDGVEPAVTSCCCRSTPPLVDPEVWTGECRLAKGGLIVSTSGVRLDYSNGRRELVEGVVLVETDPFWQGKVSGVFKLEVLGGAEMTTTGRASAALARDGVSLRLRAEAGQAVLTHRLIPVNPVVVQPGWEVTLDPADPETWAQARVEGDAGCSATSRRGGGLAQALLLALVALFVVRSRKRRVTT